MKIYLATDHAGFDLKEKIKTYLLEKNYEIEDMGAFSFDKNDDYTDFISKAAEKVSRHPTDKAIIFGGSGQGEAMLANRYRHVRAAVFYGPKMPQSPIDAQGQQSNDPFEIVRLSRIHNNANVLSLGSRMVTEEEAIHAVQIWLETPFSDNPRYARRIEKAEELI